MDTFGKRLIAAREAQRLSQKELAERLEITPTRLNYWEKDKREPNVAMIRKISEALKIDPNYLIGNLEPTIREVIAPVTSLLPPADEALLYAYHHASPEDRAIIDNIVMRYCSSSSAQEEEIG